MTCKGKRITIKLTKLFGGNIKLFTENLKELFKNGAHDELLMDIYLDENKHIDYRFYPDAEFIEIYPKSFIGNFRDGVLDFSIEKINYLIALFALHATCVHSLAIVYRRQLCFIMENCSVKTECV